MLAKVKSGAVIGIDGYLVDVEVDLAQGLPAFDIVGLPDSAVRESRDRVRTAIRNRGYHFPVKRITVNLAPADIRKSGPAFDLPIAVGILIGTNVLPPSAQAGAFFTGELSLDGAVRPVSGVLSMVLAAREFAARELAARESADREFVAREPATRESAVREPAPGGHVGHAGHVACFVPAQNAAEAALAQGVTVYPVNTIDDVVGHFEGRLIAPLSVDINSMFENKTMYPVDFADVKGQPAIKRALEVAASGYHNMLMVGPPGAGKTMLATRMPTIMPSLDFEESLEITKIYSVAGLFDKTDKSEKNDGKNQLVTNRPFRAPHHTASLTSLVGGGQMAKPGEISLAHNGVLFLDELTEFQKKTLEVLRQPLEEGTVTVSRAGGTYTYPSAFLLLASMNPCPCGYYGTDKCRCAGYEVDRYLNKVSGPLLDRMDIQTEVGAVDYQQLSTAETETSADIKKRVIAARSRQQTRFAGDTIKVNAHMTAPMIEKYCPLGKQEQVLLGQAFDTMNLSARAYHKILKIARTIADLDDSDSINVMHLTEAISYRGLDRKFW